MTFRYTVAPATDQLSTNPVKEPRTDARLSKALGTACRIRGIDDHGARLVHRYNNAVYHLPSGSLVARVTADRAVGQIAAIQRVVGWLAAERGIPATRPVPEAHPVTVDDLVISFWKYYPQPGEKGFDSVHLARALAPLHQAESPTGFDLAEWKPLTSLLRALADPTISIALADRDRDWLIEYVGQVRSETMALDWPLGTGVIHGDAWAGNLLWDRRAGPGTAVLGDWDNVCVGPREVDLIPTWHAAVRYGKGRGWTRRFAVEYGYDLAVWPGFDTLMRMRDLVQLTGPLRRAAAEPVLADGLQQRFQAIRRGDRAETWRAF